MTTPCTKAKMGKQTAGSVPSTIWLVLGMFLLLPSCCHCFLFASISAMTVVPSATSISMVHSHDLRDPDMMEIILGCERYENVPLPDSMLETTIFVGNLCEFAKDEDLSQKFRSVTNLISLPACVARRPNSQSLRYGFVAFPTVEEKEVCLNKFDIPSYRTLRRDSDTVCGAFNPFSVSRSAFFAPFLFRNSLLPLIPGVCLCSGRNHAISRS